MHVIDITMYKIMDILFKTRNRGSFFCNLLMFFEGLGFLGWKQICDITGTQFGASQF